MTRHERLLLEIKHQKQLIHNFTMPLEINQKHLNASLLIGSNDNESIISRRQRREIISLWKKRIQKRKVKINSLYQKLKQED